MKIKYSNKTLRFGGRDIILVTKENGETQPFYRSTGRNSGCPGTWFPFDGISDYYGFERLWFNKERFCNPLAMYRYGEEENFEISRFLAGQDIPEGEIKTPFEINKFLNTKETLYNNKSEFIKNWTFDGENQKYFK